ncbi:hypothetical protein H6F89_08705 [Cyanobacteria bacterium FACHB-63]|nr:hypothetical protein [Cyanobacteria bacterium FACHB-63]
MKHTAPVEQEITLLPSRQNSYHSHLIAESKLDAATQEFIFALKNYLDRTSKGFKTIGNFLV